MENDNGMTLREILKKYGSLSEECLQEFESQAVMESYMRKEVIVPQGKICDSLYFTSQGLTRVAFHRGRKEDTICFGGAGDVFMSFHSLYGSQKAVFSLVAITDLTCYRVSNNSFRMLRQKYPDVQRWFANILMEQLYSFEELYSRLSLATPEERMRRFWDLKSDNLRAMSASQLTRVVPLKIIAQYLGMTAQTLSRVHRYLVGK